MISPKLIEPSLESPVIHSHVIEAMELNQMMTRKERREIPLLVLMTLLRHSPKRIQMPYKLR
jgi:hypothetical protein